MSWFFVALAGPILYAFTNHFDKYIISKYFKSGGVGSLLIFSSLFSVLALPIVALVEPAVLDASFRQTVALALTGALFVSYLIFYFYALQEEEASVVVPYMQTVPIFAFAFGFFFLGELPTGVQMLGAAIVIAGSVILSLDIGGDKVRVKARTAVLMFASSLLFALGATVFKFLALEGGFWVSTFWVLAGKVLFGILLFLFVPSYRREFLTLLSENRMRLLALNGTNETLSVLADAVTTYATLLAPVVLVLTVSSLQPLFVFLMGVALTVFFPHLGSESLARRSVAQKIAAIAVIAIGSNFINF